MFRQIPEPVLLELAEHAQVQRFAAGATVFQQDDAADGLYVLASGAVEISATLESGGRQVISHVTPGDVFGEMAVLDNLPRSASATATAPSEAYFIPRGQMVGLFRRSPDVAVELVKEVSRRLREFNRQHLREMLQAERLAAVGRFARAIVHDLKNPLATIRLSAAQACAPKSTPPERDTALNWINRQVDRATELADDIIDFTQRPPAALALEPLDFSALVLSVVTELQMELGVRKVVIQYVNPPPAVPLRVDPRRLPRVFANLLRNAADAMPAGGTVSLRFRQTTEEVSTEIRDAGPGISAEIKPRLFDAFATFGKPKGTGLGLAICKQIVEEHNGSISAANHPQKGAIFTFTLPRPT